MVNKDEIASEAKQILERFSKALEKVKVAGKREEKETGGFREEKESVRGDEDFRRRMFANAPNKNEDAIIAEKKKW